MAVRAGMVGLIRMVQRLIGDDPASPAFDLEDVQDALDARRVNVRYELLRGTEFMQPGGKVIFVDFYAELDFWEEDAQLFDSAFNPFSMSDLALADYLTGHWKFKLGQSPIVYLIGQSYDPYGASAELCEAWAARLAAEYDFSDKQVSLKRSQAGAAKLALAARYSRKARPQSATQVRSDVDGAQSGTLGDTLLRAMRLPY